jgi:hypothetical protein
LPDWQCRYLRLRCRYLRQNELSIEQCKRVLELYPDFVPAHQLLGIVYGQAKSQDRSFAELNLAESLEKGATSHLFFSTMNSR